MKITRKQIRKIIKESTGVSKYLEDAYIDEISEMEAESNSIGESFIEMDSMQHINDLVSIIRYYFPHLKNRYEIDRDEYNKIYILTIFK